MAKKKQSTQIRISDDERKRAAGVVDELRHRGDPRIALLPAKPSVTEMVRVCVMVAYDRYVLGEEGV